MFSVGKLCRKISVLVCLFVFSLFLNFSLCSSASASSMQVNHFNASYKTDSSSNYVWSNDLSYNQTLSPYAVDGFYTQWALLTPTGNNMSVHYEVNFVIMQPISYTTWHGSFLSAGISGLTVGDCDWGGSAVPILNQSVSTNLTYWSSSTANKQTLTFYIDFNVSDIPQTAGRLHCYVASDYHSDYPFWRGTSEPYPDVYFERSSTTYSFSNQIDNTLLQSMVNQNQTIINQNDTMILNQQAQTDAINNSEDGEQQRWEQDRQDLQDQTDTVQDNLDDFSFTPTNVTNPFEPWMFNNPFTETSSGGKPCVWITQIPSWFSAGNIRVCSPFPTTIYNVLSAVTTTLVCAFLIRIYFKHTKEKGPA